MKGMKRVACACDNGKVKEWDWGNPADYWTEKCSRCDGAGWLWYDEAKETTVVPRRDEVRDSELELHCEYPIQVANRRKLGRIARELLSLSHSERMEALEDIGGVEAEAIKQLMEEVKKEIK